MNTEERPKMPREQIIYGEIVYWVTILAALICMIGPVIAMSNVENNVLNPHFLFAKIFEGKSSETIWGEVGPFKLTQKSLDKIEKEGVPEDVMKRLDSFKNKAFKSGDEAIKVLEKTLGKDLLEKTMDKDKTVKSLLLKHGGGFPGGHFYLGNFTLGDGFTQFGLALGCSVALWALIITAFVYLSEKTYIYVFLAFWVSLLVFLSASGIIKGH